MAASRCRCPSTAHVVALCCQAIGKNFLSAQDAAAIGSRLYRDDTEMTYACTCLNVCVPGSLGLIDDVAFPDACEEVRVVVQHPFTQCYCATSIPGPDRRIRVPLFRKMYLVVVHATPTTCRQVLSRAALWRLGAEKILATPSMEEGTTVLGSLARSAMRKYLLEFEDDKCRVIHEVVHTSMMFCAPVVICFDTFARTWKMRSKSRHEVSIVCVGGRQGITLMHKHVYLPTKDRARKPRKTVWRLCRYNATWKRSKCVCTPV